MTAKQDLIAAALTLADTHPGDIGGIYHAQKDLQEMCARAMVQPVSEVPLPEADCVTFSRTHEGFGVRVDALRMDSAIRYGDAREAAVWAKVAMALDLGTGGAFAESYLLGQIAALVEAELDVLDAHRAGEAAGYAAGVAASVAALVALKHQSGVNPDGTAWRLPISRQDCVEAVAALRGEVKP